jgi:hypothetical protein
MTRLRSGGVLLIIDYNKYEMVRPKNMPGASQGFMGHAHGQQGHQNHHNHQGSSCMPQNTPLKGADSNVGSATTKGGFDEAEIVVLMQKAGLKNVKYSEGVKGFTWGPPPGMEKMAQGMGMPKIVRDIFLARGDKV